MKKLAKTLFMSLIAAAASSAIAADMNSKLVKFAAENETYKDGAPVLAGEWLALCWSADGTFDGLKADCTPVDSADKVIRVIKWAEEGCCPPIVFVLDGDDVKTEGFYNVVRLDTRVSATAVAAANDTGLPEFVNATMVEDYAADASAGSVGSTVAVSAAGSTFNVEDTVVTPASLTILTTGQNAKVTAINLNPLVTYCIKSGKTLSLENAPVTVDKSVFDRSAEVTFSFEDANFFKLDVVK